MQSGGSCIHFQLTTITQGHDHFSALYAGDPQGELAVKSESLPVSGTLGDIWKRFAERAAKRDLRVAISLPPVNAQGARALLTAILSNRCVNAVDYTPEGGDIALVARIQGDRTVIEIANTTRELRAEEVSKLLDRFWRKEAARSDGSHGGLGLSLSRSFAQAMAWSLEATLKDERLTFELSEPAVACSSLSQISAVHQNQLNPIRLELRCASRQRPGGTPSSQFQGPSAANFSVCSPFLEAANA